MRNAARLLIIGLVVGALAQPANAGDDPPPPPQRPVQPADLPIPIILNAPADRDSLLKMLARPDLVILDGEAYRKLRQAADGEKAKPDEPTPAAVVESVGVGGEVVGDWARLGIELRIAMAVEGSAWASIHLDGLTLSQVREGDRDLPARQAEGRPWQVELRGKGEHVVRVDCLAPVRATPEGRRLELAIPTAASSRFDVKVPGNVLDASTGPGEPVALAVVNGVEGVRLAARLGPRNRLELTWREPAEAASRLPDLLSAQGEIAVEIEAGSIRSRGSWTIAAIRGSASELKVRLDPTEEVLEAEVDGRPVQVEAHREGGKLAVTIPLADPIRLNASRGLVMTTRRPLSTAGSVRVVLQGCPFDHARVQTGLMAISRTGPLFLLPSVGRGVRRIDPRTELPESLRTRRDTSLAFEFTEQPFDLSLDIEPAPVRLRVDSRTTINVGPRQARLDTRLDCRVSQGKAFEVRVALPPGLDLVDAGPTDIVASPQIIQPQARTVAAQARGVEPPRILALALLRQMKESEVFTIQLRGRCSIDPSRPVTIPLFQPLADSANGGRVAVVSDRDLSVELGEAGDEPSAFRVEWGPTASDWEWPAGKRPGRDSGLLRFRYDGSPETLPLRLQARPVAIRHTSTTSANIARAGVEVVDELAGDVAFGTLERGTIVLPADVPGRWELEGAELESREPVAVEADGSRRYPVRISGERAESFRIRVHYRLPFREPPTTDRPARFKLTPVRLAEGTSEGQAIKLLADPSLDLKAEGGGWTAAASTEPAVGADPGSPARLTLNRSEDKAGPLDVSVQAEGVAALPRLVASRLWIRTLQGSDNDLATVAYYWIESRDGPITIALPPGSRLFQARLGRPESSPVDVEALGGDRYRLRFPSTTPSGSLLLAIDYLVPASRSPGRWPGPTLEGGLVQQTQWEVRLIGSRAGVGVPEGWTDENQWFWDGWLWRRRPWRSPAELSQWLTGGSVRNRIADPLESEGQGGRHGYLFSRSGPPTPLGILVVARMWLLVLCSGPVLLAGLLVLARRPPPRLLIGAAMVLIFAVAGLAESNTAIVLVQSSLLGFALFLSATVLNRALDRRGAGRLSGVRPIPLEAGPVESPPHAPPSPGSDDSTAIRVRTTSPAASTADHIILARPRPRDPGDSQPSGVPPR